jgi:RHH-type rel operon transcriptional repressor/antitoxin RelB
LFERKSQTETKIFELGLGSHLRASALICVHHKILQTLKFPRENSLFLLSGTASIQGAQMKTINVRIPDEIAERLDRLAQETHRTKSFYLREIIDNHLEDIEDAYLAEKRLEDIRAGKTTTIPLSEVTKRLDLEY